MGTEIALYIDGSPAGSTASGGLPGINGDVLIGALEDSGVAGGFTGELDEVEISKISRSAWWARVTALGQSPDTTLVAYGSDESKGTAGRLAAYVAMMSNLLAQVSLDGLVVITITGLMGLASLQVLFSKATLLKRVERQDNQFIAGFPDRFAREVKATATGLKDADDAGYEASGLHGMYRAGLGGLQAVVAAPTGHYPSPVPERSSPPVPPCPRQHSRQHPRRHPRGDLANGPAQLRPANAASPGTFGKVTTLGERRS